MCTNGIVMTCLFVCVNSWSLPTRGSTVCMFVVCVCVYACVRASTLEPLFNEHFGATSLGKILLLLGVVLFLKVNLCSET